MNVGVSVMTWKLGVYAVMISQKDSVILTGLISTCKSLLTKITLIILLDVLWYGVEELVVINHKTLIK